MPNNRRDNLANLRAEVRKRRSAVTAKENRIKRRTGVDIRGTREDPRQPVSVVNNYNKRQLNAYLNKLNAFMSRSVGYVAGANNAPIPKADWLNYKKLEKQYNSIGDSHFDKIAGIFIPTAGMTISQRDSTMRPDSVNAQGDIVVRPYSKVERRSTNIPSAEALAKLTDNLKKKVRGDFLPSQIKQSRKQLNDMLTTIGNSDLIKKANSLSDNQFDVLWNYTNFATNVSGIYYIMQKQTADSGDRWYTSVVEDYSSDIGELFNWAQSLPDSETRSKRSPARSQKGKKARRKR